jgi:hypothetical protein
MLKLNADTKIVCCCEQGQVRSVATRNILHRLLNNKNILAAGLRKNNEATLRMLFTWADIVLITGEQRLLLLMLPGYADKTIHINVGEDRWGNPFHAELHKELEGLLATLLA